MKKLIIAGILAFGAYKLFATKKDDNKNQEKGLPKIVAENEPPTGVNPSWNISSQNKVWHNPDAYPHKDEIARKRYLELKAGIDTEKRRLVNSLRDDDIEAVYYVWYDYYERNIMPKKNDPTFQEYAEILNRFGFDY